MTDFRNKILFLFLFSLIAPASCTFIYGNTIDEEVKDAICAQDINYSGLETIIFWVSKSKTRAGETKVYSNQSGMMRIEYLSPKHLSHHVIIDDGKFEYLYDTLENTAVKSVSCNACIENLDDKFNLLKKNYDLVRAGSESIAGRKTDIIELKSKNNDNYLRKLWIDKKYHVILQDKVYKNKCLIHESHFTSISFPEEIPEDLFTLPETIKIIVPEQQVTVFKDIAELQKKSKLKIFLPSFLPERYSFDRANLVVEKNSEYVQIQYSNGLDILSIFEVPQKIELSDYKFFEESMNYTVLQKKYKGIKLMLIGNISGKNMEKIMKSIK